MHQRRLPRPRGAHDGDELAIIDGKRDTAQCGCYAFFFAVGLYDIFGLDKHTRYFSRTKLTISCPSESPERISENPSIDRIPTSTAARSRISPRKIRTYRLPSSSTTERCGTNRTFSRRSVSISRFAVIPFRTCSLLSLMVAVIRYVTTPPISSCVGSTCKITP